MKQVLKLKAFTLIEILVSIAILGIVSSIALPAYFTYSAKAKVSMMIALAEAPQQSVLEYYVKNGLSLFNANISNTAGSNPFPALSFPTKNPIVNNITVVGNGIVQINGKPNAIANNITVNIAFVPTIVNNKIMWTCKTNSTNNYPYVPTSCQNSCGVMGSVYNPSSCRQVYSNTANDPGSASNLANQMNGYANIYYCGSWSFPGTAYSNWGCPITGNYISSQTAYYNNSTPCTTETYCCVSTPWQNVYEC